MKLTLKCWAALTPLFLGAAQAHVVLDQTAAPAGSSYRAVFRVGHGCDGLPTTGIAVRVPTGVMGAKPMPKPGWRLEIKTEKLAEPMTMHGQTMESGVAEIVWSASSADAALPDADYDEFVMRATLPATPGMLWFKVVQTCDDHGRPVRKEWTQVPESGASIRGLTLPAAPLQVTPAAGAVPIHP